MAGTTAEQIYKLLYKLPPPPHRTRPPDRPMQILALGLPRSGTDSLRSALLKLGYSGIWHGFDLPSIRSNECAVWVPLLQAKTRGDDGPLRQFDWDTLLGDCNVVMDMPPGMFAEELLDFYPDAKVILNRRKDMDAWYRSLLAAANTVRFSGIWALSWWDSHLFWWYWTTALWVGIMGKREGLNGFKQNGKEWAREHYDRLETKLKREEREYLDWHVEQGWDPLCEFLSKDVPNQDFPRGNKSGVEFEKNIKKSLEMMVKRAVARIVATTVVLAAGVAGLWWRSH